MKRSKPFKFTLKPLSGDRNATREFLTVRTDEIEYFLQGLLDGDGEMPLPDEIRDEIKLPAENDALRSATLDLLNDVAATDEEISDLASNLRELNRVAGIQINDIIMACVRWRRESITVH